MSNEFLVAVTTACFGVATGMFFVLYCLERPLFDDLFRNRSGAEATAHLRRVLVDLQWIAKRAPFVMAPMMIFGAVLATVRLMQDGFGPLLAGVAVVAWLFVVVSALTISRSISRFRDQRPDAPKQELHASVRPIVRDHFRSLLHAGLLLVLQVASRWS